MFILVCPFVRAGTPSFKMERIGGGSGDSGYELPGYFKIKIKCSYCNTVSSLFLAST